MREVLVVGGTRFVGRHIVTSLRDRGMRVTLFNRGRHADTFPDLPQVHGDRDRPDQLEPLAEREWDAVVDTCAYRPPQVEALLDALAGEPHYTLVSTVSVYDERGATGIDEGGALHSPQFEGEVDGRSYGPLKVGCETVAGRSGLPLLVVRPGVVAGPHDPTDRFTYWVTRVAAGGAMLAPEGPDAEVQWIDVRDLGDWVADSVAERRTGEFNIVNPAGRDTLGGLFAAAERAAGASVEPVWAPGSFLEEHGVRPFMDMPLWLPADTRMIFSSDRARAAGLHCRPTEETVRDVLAWARVERGDEPHRAGLPPDREQALIAAWRAQQEGSAGAG